MTNQLLKEALAYLDQGFSVLPVVGKVPALKTWTEYQERRPTREEIEGWFSDSTRKITGVAIVCGKVSGIIVLDIENDFDYSSLEIPDTPTVETGSGGRHFYFKNTTGVYPPSVNLRSKGIIGEFRANGNIVVAPPSIHPITGRTYRWLKDLNTPMAEIPDWLKELGKNTEIPSGTKKSIKNIKRILEGVGEGERNDSATVVIGKLMHFLPEHEWERTAWPLLRGWNQLNSPPLSPQELWRTFHSIRRKHLKEKPREASGELKPLSVKDLLALQITETQWVVRGLIPPGINALSGHPSVGKSWISLAIAEAVASGGALFGKFECERRPVLIVDEESGVNEYAKRIRLLNIADDLPIHLLSFSETQVDEAGSLNRLISKAQELGVGLIIFDSFSQIHSKQENSADEMQKVMRGLQQLVKLGIAVVVIHHHRKDQIGAHSPAQGLRGSVAILGRLDSLLVASKEDNASNEITISQEKLRNGKTTPAFSIRLEANDSEVRLVYGEEIEPQKTRHELIQEATIRFLATETGGVLRRELIRLVVKDTGSGDRTVDTVVKKMCEKGLITISKDGKQHRYQLSLPEF